MFQIQPEVYNWSSDLDVHVPVRIHEVHKFLHVAQLLVPLAEAIIAEVIAMGHQDDVASVQLGFLLVLFPQSPGTTQTQQLVSSESVKHKHSNWYHQNQSSTNTATGVI